MNSKGIVKHIVFFLFTSYGVLLFSSGCKVLPIRKVKIESMPPVRMEPLIVPSSEKMQELVLDKIESEKEAENLFSFIVRDEEIGQVLLALSRQVPYNIVVDPAVVGKITIDMKDVTLKDALDNLTSLLGLEYEIKGKNIKVSLPKLETRIFTLNYINAKRTGTGRMTASSGVSGGSTGGGVSGGGGGGGTGSSTINTTTESDLWAEIEAGLTSMVSERGKLIINKQANMVMVSDFPERLGNIAEFLEMIEGSSHRQVMIHAKVIEVQLDDKFRLGINWSALRNIGNLAKGSLSGGFSLSQAVSPGTGNFQFGVANLDFTMLLDALSEQGTINILSSPKISTMNNQKAIIKVGREEVYFDPQFSPVTSTDPSTGIIADSRSVLTSVLPRTVTVGIVLDVIPQISQDGFITMNIHPSVTELVKVAEFKQGSNVLATAPVIDIRETDTVVRVKDGQSIIIAGMMQEKESETVTKSPLLGNIPGIGSLFRQTNQTLTKTELIILLTPTVMVGKRIEELTYKDLRKLEDTKRAFNRGILGKKEP